MDSYVLCIVVHTIMIPYSGKFSKNLCESDFEKIFSKILLLSQLSSCAAIEIQKNIFENDWLYIFVLLRVIIISMNASVFECFSCCILACRSKTIIKTWKP